jgi:hypothetical protein
MKLFDFFIKKRLRSGGRCYVYSEGDRNHRVSGGKNIYEIFIKMDCKEVE